MKRFYSIFLLTFLVIASAPAFATTWVITNSGNNFSPSTVTITLGDTVVFTLQSPHNAVEVSQATWNNNQSTSNGGFSLPTGGGMVVPTTVKTYYYVCQPHAGSGMKGQIIVNSSTGIGTPAAPDFSLRFSPNPVKTTTKVHTGLASNIAVSLTIFDLTGKAVLVRNKVTEGYSLDVSSLARGIYFAEIRGDEYVRTAKFVVAD